MRHQQGYPAQLCSVHPYVHLYQPHPEYSQKLINFRILILAVVVRAVALEQFKVAVRIIIVRSPSAITDLIIMLWEYFAVDVSVCYLTDLHIDSKCILPLLLKSLNDSLALVSICCNYFNCDIRSISNTKFLHSSVQVFCSFVLISIQWI